MHTQISPNALYTPTMIHIFIMKHKKNTIRLITKHNTRLYSFIIY